MSSVDAGTVLAAIVAFASTNIDDICLLIVFFARAASAAPRGMTPFRVVAGQTLGFSVLVMLSLVGIVLGVFIEAKYVQLIGLLPLCMGLWGVWGLLRELW
jgi:cadmium resistance protein CadD (predicted permease)